MLATSGAGMATFSKAANGYIKFANGIIIQWGSIAVSGRTNHTVTCSTSFSNTTYIVQTQTLGANLNDYNNATAVTGITGKNTFTICPGYGESRTVMWIAIGY